MSLNDKVSRRSHVAVQLFYIQKSKITRWNPSLLMTTTGGETKEKILFHNALKTKKEKRNFTFERRIN